MQHSWQAEPPDGATDRDGILRRINWLRAQVDGINAQLAERRKEGDTTWRRKAINALNYRMAELREQRLRLSHAVNNTPQMRALLGRMLAFAEDIDGLEPDEEQLLDEVRDCLS